MVECCGNQLRGERLLNVWGALLAIVMILSGVIVCSQLSQAREFMIGLYLILFGMFALIIEFKRFEPIIKWLPAMDTYFGKGFFFVFWGFLLFGEDIGFQILAVIFLASGVAYMLAQFMISNGPIHFMGDDSFADRKAQDTLRNYERNDPEAPPQQDPYLANVAHPNSQI